jgi:hypothetical protein
MTDTIKAVISKEGTKLTFIYTDKLQPILKHGKATIKRVSNVEPTEDGKWQACMADGTILRKHDLREDALKEEVRYLEEKLYGTKSV